MGGWHIYLHEMVDLDGKCIGKYTQKPMDPLGTQDFQVS